jgi:hypothetical protein
LLIFPLANWLSAVLRTRSAVRLILPMVPRTQSRECSSMTTAGRSGGRGNNALLSTRRRSPELDVRRRATRTWRPWKSKCCDAAGAKKMGLGKARLRLVEAGPAAKPESPAFRKTPPSYLLDCFPDWRVLSFHLFAVCFLVREAVQAVSCDRPFSPSDMHG